MKKTLVSMVTVLLAMAISASAVTNDQIVGGTALAAGLDTPVVLVGNADFTATAGATGDVFKVIYIPAYCRVLGVYSEVTTSNVTAMTFHVGDGSSDTQYSSSLNGSALTKTISASNNVDYTAASYISVCPLATCVTGKVKVKAVVVPF